MKVYINFNEAVSGRFPKKGLEMKRKEIIWQ